MPVSTSIVVQFSQNAAGGHLSAEIDSRDTGLNKGNTSFIPGDTAYFLLFKSPDVIIDALAVSAGSLVSAAGGLYDVEEWVTFADVLEMTPSKPITSGFSFQWFGNNLGPITVVGGVMRCAIKGIGVAKVKYQSQYTGHGIASPSTLNGLSDFQIAALVKGHN